MKALVNLAVAAAAFAVWGGAAASAENVRVTLTGVEARGGNILASLQSEADFMQPRGAYRAVVPAPTAAGDVVIVFEDVAPGAYAFSAMHDVNGDYQMQREENGRPQEGWAMHNGASLRATPTFDQVKVDVPASGLTLSEPMIYPR